LPPFEAGQYAVLGLPASAPRIGDSDPDDGDGDADPNRLIKRAYSIASTSHVTDYLEFYIALVRSGALTPRLFSLGIGDPIWLSRKLAGVFTLQSVPADCDVIMFATGTGLAPYVSMMRTVLAPETPRRFLVVHGARHSWDLGYSSEMVSLQHVCPAFDYLPSISRPGDEPIPWLGLVGYCQDLWKGSAIAECWGEHPRPERTHIFLCGNPKMVEDMTGLLTREGFAQHTRRSPGQIHAEKYWQST
jgi:ferredoxin--NADP+ reductase